MSIFHGDPREWRIPEAIGSAVAIGTFDGVHRGHQSVLADLRETPGLVPAALTFDVHPLSLVAPEAAPGLLGTVDQRVEWLQEKGAEVVGVLPFGLVREWSPQAFVDVVLRDALNARVVAVGSDFRFGYGRKGDVSFLLDAADDAGFTVHELDLLGEESGKYSSTEIRRLLGAGDVGIGVTTGAWALVGLLVLLLGRRDGRKSFEGAGWATLGVVAIRLVDHLADLEPLVRVMVFLAIGVLFLAGGWYARSGRVEVEVEVEVEERMGEDQPVGG